MRNGVLLRVHPRALVRVTITRRLCLVQRTVSISRTSDGACVPNSERATSRLCQPPSTSKGLRVWLSGLYIDPLNSPEAVDAKVYKARTRFVLHGQDASSLYGKAFGFVYSAKPALANTIFRHCQLFYICYQHFSSATPAYVDHRVY